MTLFVFQDTTHKAVSTVGGGTKTELLLKEDLLEG